MKTFGGKRIFLDICASDDVITSLGRYFGLASEPKAVPGALGRICMQKHAGSVLSLSAQNVIKCHE